MDEEDGRTGPRARKFGPFDVLTDAFAGSLRNRQIHSPSFGPYSPQFIAPITTPTQTHASPRVSCGADLSALAVQVKEKQYENVPGK